jgi:PAS domain S-box-containing protein
MEPETKSCVLSKVLPALISLIDDPVVLVDKKGKLLTANKGAEEISEYSQKELVGKSILELPLFDGKARALPEGTKAKRLCNNRTAIQTGDSKSNVGGETTWVNLPESLLSTTTKT